MRISVIVPTYNRPRALELCLRSLARQSLLPSEVLVADDGSTPETADALKSLQRELGHAYALKHVWQEDKGFRKPKILNEAARQSTGEYLIFIDGDCIAHRHFVRAHVQHSDRNAILSGKRAEIGQDLTERLQQRGSVPRNLAMRLLADSLLKKSRKVEEAFQIANPLLRRLMHRDRITNDGVWGCNFSLYKQLFLDINGCDEDFLDGSIEDNDLGIRVLNQGKQVKSVRGLAVIYHLWHQSSWSFVNDIYQHNRKIMLQRIENKEPTCRNGIRKL